MKKIDELLGEVRTRHGITPKREAKARQEITRQHTPPPSDKSRLLPERNKQGDFFVADIFDAMPKDDTASMEHPLFALKAGDRRVREYKRNGVTVIVQPGVYGCATIHDKDLWIYCIRDRLRKREKIVRQRKHNPVTVVRLCGRWLIEERARLPSQNSPIRAARCENGFRERSKQGSHWHSLLSHDGFPKTLACEKVASYRSIFPEFSGEPFLPGQ